MNYNNFLDKMINEKFDPIHDNLMQILAFHQSMKDFEYGFYNNKRYTGKILDKDGTFNNYKLMKPEDVEKYKVCVCWDAVKYEAKWFKDNLPNITVKCYYCEYEPNIGNTHTWLTFKLNNDWYVFEHTWYSKRGVKKINLEQHLKSYINDIPKSEHTPNKLKNAKWVLFEYEPLKEENGLNCIEFMNSKWKDGKLLKTNCNSWDDLISTYEFNENDIKNLKLKEIINPIKRFNESYDFKCNWRIIRFPSAEAKKLLIKDSECKKYLNSLINNDVGEVIYNPDNNEIIGYVFVHNKKDKGFIFNLIVKPKYRGQGFGKILIKDAINKFGGIDLTVKKKNDIAVNLYKKNGFKIVGNGNSEAEYYMKLSKKKLNEEYEPPMSLKEIKRKYGNNLYNKLKSDPVHKWRAETGIELIHKEPSKEELERIMRNWESMDNKRKRLSDKKSMEVFGCNNIDNYNNLIKTYNETPLETRLTDIRSNFEKEVTLYHGTDHRIPNKIIDPAYGRINVGTRLSRPRYSTWWTKNPFFPFYYCCNEVLTKILYDNGYIERGTKINLLNLFELTKRYFCVDADNNVLYINKILKNDIMKNLNKNPGYIYKVTVPWKLVGRGHDVTLDEYTLDIPVQAEEIVVDYKTLCRNIDIRFINESECVLRSTKLHIKKGDLEFRKVPFMHKLVYHKMEDRRVKYSKMYNNDLTRRKQERLKNK